MKQIISLMMMACWTNYVLAQTTIERKITCQRRADDCNGLYMAGAHKDKILGWE